MMCGGCHGGQVHSAHHGQLMHYNMPRLHQSLYTRGGRWQVRRIAMDGRSYQRDRYVGQWIRTTQENKPSWVAHSLLTKLLCGALPRGGKHEDLSASSSFPKNCRRKDLPVGLCQPLTLTTVDARGDPFLDSVPLGSLFPTTQHTQGLQSQVGAWVLTKDPTIAAFVVRTGLEPES